MRSSQDKSERWEAPAQGQHAQTLQAMKRGRINERPNLALVIKEEEPGIHQGDGSCMGRTSLGLKLGERREEGWPQPKNSQ